MILYSDDDWIVDLVGDSVRISYFEENHFIEELKLDKDLFASIPGKMYKNKYLDDLGIERNKYGVNFTEDSKKYIDQRIEYGFDSRECWDLCSTTAEWIYSHLQRYKSDVKDIIDLTYHKFNIDNKEVTMLDAINYVIDMCREYITMSKECKLEEENKIYSNLQNGMKVYAEILPMLWW